MSPSSLRRYRAERLLRGEFRGLRARVLAAVGARLRGAGIELDRGDLESAYALAWQGLYAAVLEGQEIESPASWLVLVTFRRAVEEHRSRRRPTHGLPAEGPPDECDLAAELDSRIRLGHMLEGLSRLSGRERQAATLCYLQGFSRAEAAARMGIGEGRMRKLMEGRGAGEPGVAGKIGALARTIDEGTWCESQGSLMRALAYGILDRHGERYRLALSHQRRCPSCRAYVLSLRGLAAGLPPVLLGGPRLALAGLAGGAGRTRTALAHLLRRGTGATGASGAGGGLALGGGPLTAKLAVGCLMAIGVGAGCIGIAAPRGPGPHRAHARTARLAPRGAGDGRARGALGSPGGSAAGPPGALAPGTAPSAARAELAREFGPERAAGPSPAAGPTAAPRGLIARRQRRPAPAGGQVVARVSVVASGAARARRAAAREFAP